MNAAADTYGTGAAAAIVVPKCALMAADESAKLRLPFAPMNREW